MANWALFDWIKLKRMVGISPSTPLATQEGQVRYARDGDTDGKAYLARYLTGGTYEWKDLTAGGGGGSTITINEGGVLVEASADTLNVDGSDFNTSVSPAGTVNLSLNYGTTAGTPAEGDHTHAGVYQPLDADLTTIAGLADPNADRILFWDDSAGGYAYLAAGTGLTITGTTIDASGLTHQQVMGRIMAGG